MIGRPMALRLVSLKGTPVDHYRRQSGLESTLVRVHAVSGAAGKLRDMRSVGRVPAAAVAAVALLTVSTACTGAKKPVANATASASLSPASSPAASPVASAVTSSSPSLQRQDYHLLSRTPVSHPRGTRSLSAIATRAQLRSRSRVSGTSPTPNTPRAQHRRACCPRSGRRATYRSCIPTRSPLTGPSPR